MNNEQPEQEQKLTLTLPDYLGFALSKMSFDDIPEPPDISWFVTTKEDDTGKSQTFAVMTVFTKNHINNFWFDHDDLVKLVINAQRAGVVLEQEMAKSQTLTVASEGQMIQTIENMKKVKRNMLTIPEN